MLIGTFCRFSSRFCAVTMMSSPYSGAGCGLRVGGLILREGGAGDECGRGQHGGEGERGVCSGASSVPHDTKLDFGRVFACATSVNRATLARNHFAAAT